jgi:hypothetical protein
MCKSYKETFLNLIKDAFDKGKINYHENYETIYVMKQSMLTILLLP